MRWTFALTLSFMVSTVSFQAYGLDFDKEIRRQERVTVTMVDKLDRKRRDHKATKQARTKKRGYTVTLIQKNR